MTLNDTEWLFQVKIRFQPAVLDSERLTFKNTCVNSNKYKGIGLLSAVEMYVNDSRFKQYSLNYF